MNGLPQRVRAWERLGGYQTVGGHRIFVRRHDGSPDAPFVVLLHGYPSSSYDWRNVFDAITATGASVLAFDFLGFGLSDKPALPHYSLKAQADLVEQLIAGRPARLIGHDMGTSVTNELKARDIDGQLSFTIDAVLLFNGSMVLEKAHLTPSQKALRSRIGPLVARFSSSRMFRLQFARIFSKSHPLTADEAADQWALLAHLGGNRIIDRLTYYLHERVEYASRWHGAIRDWPGRLELCWAGQDPVCVEAVLSAVRELRPAAPLTRWPELGHYPQIEDPVQVGSRLADYAR
jgi:pimeloyl-ACP methyl ester carboxylesterase